MLEVDFIPFLYQSQPRTKNAFLFLQPSFPVRVAQPVPMVLPTYPVQMMARRGFSGSHFYPNSRAATPQSIISTHLKLGSSGASVHSSGSKLWHKAHSVVSIASSGGQISEFSRKSSVVPEKNRELEITEEEVSKTYTGLDRSIAESYIASNMTPSSSKQNDNDSAIYRD